MKKGTVKISKEFVTSIGLKEWIGLELEYDMNTECPKEVLTNAKTIVEQWHKENNPLIPDNIIHPAQTSPIGIIQTKEEDREIGITPESIMSSPDLKVLETYRWLIKGKPELERSYILRYDQLTNSDGK
jgi:hypothetical protein